MSDTLRVFAAGSLRHAFPPMLEAFEKDTGARTSLILGPAGLLRERIEGGEPFDLFASANMVHPRFLVDLGMATDPVCFARNRFAIIARADLGLAPETWLDLLADPTIRIGISTPRDDPSGDYAFAVFDMVETQYPGLGAALKQRARQLVGGRNSPPALLGRGPGYLISDGEADVTMGYLSNAATLKNDPAFTVIEIPPAYSPSIEYGLVLARRENESAQDLKGFILSERGQAYLRQASFIGVNDEV
jgi:molybdate transport system substrate-binding protein